MCCVLGVRENGGQYTHAALWVVGALAALGRRERAAALLEMLGPVHHTRTPEAVAVYRVEPYGVAADVYGAPPHVGRGGGTGDTGPPGGGDPGGPPAPPRPRRRGRHPRPAR